MMNHLLSRLRNSKLCALWHHDKYNGILVTEGETSHVCSRIKIHSLTFTQIQTTATKYESWQRKRQFTELFLGWVSYHSLLKQLPQFLLRFPWHSRHNLCCCHLQHRELKLLEQIRNILWYIQRLEMLAVLEDKYFSIWHLSNLQITYSRLNL